MKTNILTSDQYEKLVQKEVGKIIGVLKKLADDQIVKELDVSEDEKGPSGDLVGSVNLRSKIFRKKIPKLGQYNIDLISRLQELSKFKKKLGREEILEHAIINHMVEAMYVTDLQGNIVIINESAKEILGYGSETNLLGQNVFSVIEWRDGDGQKIEKEDRPLTRVINKGKMVRVSFFDGWVGVSRQGKIFPVRMDVSPIRLSGKIIAVVVVFHDTTKEGRIDEIKSDFISIASHQLRTPLAVSTLHTEMLLAGHLGSLNQEQEEYVREINFYNKKMSELLDIFLSISKIEMDTFTMEVELLPLGSILDDIIREMLPDIDGQKITIIKNNFHYLSKVYADRGLIRIAFQNIISNAIKYTPVGGKIFIEIKKSGEHLLVKIKDTGIGISEKDKSRVFMKLYRGNNAKKIDSSGSGLGLYIAKSFIEKNQGEIWFDSQINVGTTFFVLLPTKAPTKNLIMNRKKLKKYI